MKLVALCLFAVCCSPLVNSTTKPMQIRKLKEVLTELNLVKDSLQKSKMMFNAPPQDIENGCCLEALACFRDNLKGPTNFADTQHIKLYRSLGRNLTKSSLAFCASGNNSTCQLCKSFPEVNGREFFSRLESLLQMALSHQSMD